MYYQTLYNLYHILFLFSKIYCFFIFKRNYQFLTKNYKFYNVC